MTQMSTLSRISLKWSDFSGLFFSPVINQITYLTTGKNYANQWLNKKSLVQSLYGDYFNTDSISSSAGRYRLV